jgi:hypothetical protein
MKHNHHPFENQIFEHYRDQVKKIKSAIELLRFHGYTIIDLEGKILVKSYEEKKSETI